MKNIEQKAPVIAMSIALFLAIIKFVAWILSWSIALLSSAVDSLLDSWVSIFNYFAIKFSKEEADKEHNYWHGKIEAIAASIEWTIITLSWIYIIYESIQKLIHPEKISHITWSIIVMWISIIATLWLVYFLRYVYKKTNNLVIKADIIHYKMDLYINISVIIVLIILNFYPTISWIDWIVGLFIGLYIIYEAYSLIKEWVNLLLDKALKEHGEVEKIIKKYLENKEFESYHDLKTRSSGSTNKFVEFHFVMPPETTIFESHKIWEKMEKEIININTQSKWHIVWHVDYFDDSK
jgi:cation diffusion facilitator family transporter